MMANMIRCNVDRPSSGSLQDDQLVDCRLEGWTRPFQETERLLNRKWKPPVDISESDSHYLITLEVPGIDMDSMDVTFNNGLLHVKGEKLKENEIGGECCHCSERYVGSFSRSFRINGSIDAEGIDATYKDGILKVSIPKAEGSEPRKIEIH